MYVNLTHPDFALNKKMLDGNRPEEAFPVRPLPEKLSGSISNLTVSDEGFKDGLDSASQLGKKDYSNPSKRDKWSWKKPAKPIQDPVISKSSLFLNNLDNDYYQDDDNEEEETSSSSGTFSDRGRDRQSIQSIIKTDTSGLLNTSGSGIQIPTDLKGKVK